MYNKTEKITETTTIVTKLTKNEEYCFRVSAVNEIGTSEASDASKYVKVSHIGAGKGAAPSRLMSITLTIRENKFFFFFTFLRLMLSDALYSSVWPRQCSL